MSETARHSMYHDAQRALQRQFDSVRLADRLEAVKVHDVLSDSDRDFIAGRDMMFVATVSPDGLPSCSYKGGDVGFVRVVDEHTLEFPWYDGNGMFITAGNVDATHGMGLLFIDFERPRRLRIEGWASCEPAPVDVVGAQFVVRVRIARIYPNCPRYIHTMQKVAPSVHVPHAGEESPVPDWKRTEWARDVLPGSTA